jgi:hypothetical protein
VFLRLGGFALVLVRWRCALDIYFIWHIELFCMGLILTNFLHQFYLFKEKQKNTNLQRFSW